MAKYKSSATSSVAKKTKKRYFGLTKIRLDQKLSLISKEDKNGWSLGLALGKRTVWLTALRFKSRSHVEASVGTKVVFIPKVNRKIK